MTKRDFYTEMIKYLERGQEVEVSNLYNESFYDEMIGMCNKEIEAIDKKNEKSKEAAKRRSESDALLGVVRSVLTDEYQTIADVSAQIEGEDVSVAKITYRLTTLVREGVAEKASVEVETPEGKKRTVMAYRLVGE